MNSVVKAVREKYPGAYDDLSDEQLTIALGNKYADAYKDRSDFISEFEKLSSPSLQPVIPEPGSPATPLAREASAPITQAFPVAEERARANIEARTPELSPTEAEQMLMTPQVSLPRFGKPGTATRGAANLLAMIPEAMTAPGTPLLATAQAIPGVREAVDALLGASMVKQGATEAGEAAVTGNREQLVTGLGTALLGAGALGSPHVGPIIADELAARRVGRPNLPVADMAARKALSILDAPAELGAKPTLLPLAAEAVGRTAPGTTRFVEGQSPKRNQPPEVPETPPEPERAMTVLEEIRAKGADTTRKVQQLFPQLSREEAASLRRQAFNERKPDAVPKREPTEIPVEKPPATGAEMGPRVSEPETPAVSQGAGNDQAKPAAEEVPLRDLERPVAPATFLGTQEGVPGMQPFDLYNLTEPIGNLEAGSTVAGKTLEDLGYRLPEKIKPAPKAPEQAPPIEAPAEAPVSPAKSSGVAAPEEPPALPETTPAEPPAQTPQQEQTLANPGKVGERTEPNLQGAPPANTGQSLSTVQAPVPAKSPKSQRQIITDLSKGLNLPIRFGRLRFPRFGGYFNRMADLIASKRANDLPVVTHEVGHKLDKEFSISSDPAIRKELDALGDPATPGSMSSWNKNRSQAYKLGEGIAEFVRYWLTNPAEAKRLAPKTEAYFEAVLDANKDFGDVLRTARSDIETWRSAEPQARLRSHISVGDNPNKTPYTLSQLTRDLVDDLHVLKLTVDDLQQNTRRTPSPVANIYQLARALRGSYGMADTFIRSGVVDFASKGITLGKSLEDALKPVGGRLEDFRVWIVAKRAQELRSQGRETGLVPGDVDTVAARFDKDPEFQKAFAAVKEWQDSLVQYAVDSGLLTEESAKAMREMNQDYVPFHRVFEVGAGEKPSVESGGSGRGLNVGKPGSLKKLHGSQRDIVDPLETMEKNAYTLVTAAEKAYIHQVLASYADKPGMGKWVERIGNPKEKIEVGLEKIRKELEDAGADLSQVPDDLMLSFFRTSRTAPFGENIIRVVRDGKPEFYRLNRDLFDTFHALDMEDAGSLIKFISAPAQLLRSGVVLAPDFGLANALRDTFSAAVISKYGTFPFEVTLRGIAALIGNPKLVAEWAAAGGRNSVEAAYFDRTKLQRFLKERISKDLTLAERALIITKSPLTALRWLTEKAEEATRIGEYQKAYEALRKGGMTEGEARRQAAFESRDRQDFAKGGAKTKILRRMTPFWNAALQGNVRLAQAFRDRPLATTLKGIAFVTLPKLLEQAVNYDDPDYWDRPQWERDLFFLIPFEKDANGHTKFIRIPTPFEVGVIFGTSVGRIVQKAKQEDDPNTRSYLSTLLTGSVPNPMPPFANVVFENFLSGKQGWDIFRGRPIVPDRLAELPPDLQWTEQTSLAARKLGGLLGFPPLKIDQIIRTTSGGIGQQAVHNLIDPVIGAVTGEKSTAKNKAPGGRFVTTPAGTMSQAVESFYDNLAKISAEAQREKQTGQPSDLGSLNTEFQRAARRMSELRKLARESASDSERQQFNMEIVSMARELNKLANAYRR